LDWMGSFLVTELVRALKMLVCRELQTHLKVFPGWSDRKTLPKWILWDWCAL
jgi:hypothetical protein